MSIDWQEIASLYGLTTEEFKIEVFKAAAALGAIDLPDEYDGSIIRFTCTDEHGPVEVLIRRPEIAEKDKH